MLKSVIAQAAVNKCWLEYHLQVLPSRTAKIKAQATKHEVTVIFLEPSYFEKIFTDAMGSKKFIDELDGST